MNDPTPDVDAPDVDAFAPPAESYPFRVVVDDDERRPWIGPDIPAGSYLLVRQTDGSWTLVPQPADPRPYRVIDRHGRGWLTCADPVHTYPHIDGPAMTIEDLAATRGPIVPVVAARRADCDAIRFTLARAGSKAMATLLRALSFVAADCEATDGTRDRLVAGRPGSWESELLLKLAAAGDSITSDRTDPASTSDVRVILSEWVFSETGRVEVAETLAGILGDLVDGRGGWDQITDQKLRRSGISESLRNYVTYQSSAYSQY